MDCITGPPHTCCLERCWGSGIVLICVDPVLNASYTAVEMHFIAVVMAVLLSSYKCVKKNAMTSHIQYGMTDINIRSTSWIVCLLGLLLYVYLVVLV